MVVGGLDVVVVVVVVGAAVVVVVVDDPVDISADNYHNETKQVLTALHVKEIHISSVCSKNIRWISVVTISAKTRFA